MFGTYIIKKLNIYYFYELLRLNLFPRYTLTSTKLMGKKLFIPDSASFLSMYKEIIEKEIYKFYTTSKNPYIIDCGANIGLSIIYFKKIFPNARIVAFEPDKKIFNLLKKNIQSFNLKNIKLIQKGVWSKKSTMNFYSEGADAGRIVTNTHINNTNKIYTIKLNDFLNKIVDFLKIDIEGAEVDVLENSKDKLSNVKNLFVEYHSFTNQKQRLDKIIKILLNQNGYAIKHLCL